MTWTLLTHLYKSFFRASSARKDTVIQIVLGLIVIALVGYSITFGFALETVISKTLKQADAITFLNGLLIYYFIGGLITRYFVQSLPTLVVQPYLHLPIRRSMIVNFLLGKSLFNIINITVFLLFSPFAFGAIARVYGIGQAWIWLLSLWFLSLIIHFVTIIVKVNLALNAMRFLSFLIISLFFAFADYFDLIQLSLVSANLFNAVLHGYTIVLILFLVILLLYYIAYQSFRNKLYPEELSAKESQTYHSAQYSFLQKFGLIGAWIRLELKMIFRNKRTREVFFMSTMFLFQQIILCYVIETQDYGLFLCIGIVSSGLFMGNYGQYIFSWQGDHFDFTLAQPTSLRAYVEAKYWLLACITAVYFLVSIPLVYFGWRIFFINLASTLYNIGVNLFVVMNMAMWDTTRISLRNGGALNYEGAGASQWLIGIPFLVGPFLVYVAFSLIGLKAVGISAIGLAGLCGIVLHKQIIDFIYKRFLDKRYGIASSFRKE